MSRSTLAVAILMVIAATVTPAKAAETESGGDERFVGLLHLGDVAAYVGAVNVSFTIAGASRLPDASGRPSSVIDVQLDGPFARAVHDYIAPSSGRVVALKIPCSTMINGECQPESLISWHRRGVAGIFGATSLLGRPLSYGEEFSLGGDCPRCLNPAYIRITPPNENSPPGTSFIAAVDAEYRTSHAPLFYPNGSLHMTWDHPFPLLVESQTQTFRLVSYARGSDPIAIGAATPPEPISLAVHPFDGNRPVEGEPFNGFPTWKSAEIESGHRIPPSEIISEIEFGTERLVATDEAELRRVAWIVHSMPSGSTPTRHEYTSDDVHVRPGSISAHVPWVAASNRGTWTLGPPCFDASAAIWDLAARGASFLDEFVRFQWVLGCGGTFATFGYGFLEPGGSRWDAVIVDPQTGDAEYAYVYDSGVEP